jgi:hypothetical protein
MLEINIKKVDNGFVVSINKDIEDELVDQTFVFTRYSQVVKFLKEHLNGKDVA